MTLSGDNVDAARELIASRPGSVTAAVERSGARHQRRRADLRLPRRAQPAHLRPGGRRALADQHAARRAQPRGRGDRRRHRPADMPETAPRRTASRTLRAAAAETARQRSRRRDGPEPSARVPARSRRSTSAAVVVPATRRRPRQGSRCRQPLPQPSFTPQPAQPVQAQPAVQPAYTPQPAQTYQAQPVQAQPVPQPAPASQWVPSHSVPPQGLRAWGAPDPSGPVVANLAPGLPIQVAEVRGAWARVICSNGWTGWIDGRIIGVAA